ncbi:MAG: hypothetical protein D3922_05130 [Candidatus Electrothrix sp. AR1]|nr:hypothetical protein [Candidatus Electrothrix sp. AR1]
MTNFQTSRSINSELLARMISTLHHRGPDRNDVWSSGPAGLGHARLSIIDLSDSGNQPMQSPCGRYVIVYNGEVYNFSELRIELERDGIKFCSHSDTEVVLHAYIRYGLEILPRLNGIFALAIWDTQKNELLLARDRFGVKPLYFHRTRNGIIFGSEIKAILASGAITPQIAPPRVS